MQFDEDLPTELVLSIFRSCHTVADAIALASTCTRFHQIFSSHKVEILHHAARGQYGPLEDAIQLVTHNESQPVHVRRDVPMSLALLKQVIHVGQVAERWCDLYPLKKWKVNYEDRRLLTPAERHRCRRTIYRLWLFSRAFHNASYPRETRMAFGPLTERGDLLHAYPDDELIDMVDMHLIFRDIIASNICPSNGAIARKVRKRFPDVDRGSLLFNLPAPPPCPVRDGAGSFGPLSPVSPPRDRFDVWHRATHYSHLAATPAAIRKSQQAKYLATDHHEPGAEGWGDEVRHYYVVEDMLKLDPGEILWLREHAPRKRDVEAYVRGLGDWFENNGATFAQSVEWVMEERGVDVPELREMLASGKAGIAAAAA